MNTTTPSQRKDVQKFFKVIRENAPPGMVYLVFVSDGPSGPGETKALASAVCNTTKQDALAIARAFVKGEEEKVFVESGPIP